MAGQLPRHTIRDLDVFVEFVCAALLGIMPALDRDLMVGE